MRILVIDMGRAFATSGRKPRQLGKAKKMSAVLAVGAHPDDVEFGCGGIVAGEKSVHILVCSQGESASHGTPAARRQEAEAAARILGAELEFTELGGDAHLDNSLANRLKLAAILRRLRPEIVLAPSLVENQHPDHCTVGKLVRDAARLARYGGVKELAEQPPHAIKALFYYAVTPQAEPHHISPLLVDVSSHVKVWRQAMEAHSSQTGARQYVDLALTRAHLHGLSAGVEYALPLYPNDPPLLSDLSALGRAARRF